jgi:TusA-related sulfurtransferase
MVSAAEFDLRGVGCLTNFVKIKLKLEELSAGELLTILLDAGRPVENISHNVCGEGYAIVSLKREDDYYRVVVKKG